MSALDSATDTVITPYICENFTLAISAMAAAEDETEAYEALAEAVVNAMTQGMSDIDILDVWLTEGCPEPAPSNIDPEDGVWTRVYRGLADEISRMLGASDIADMIGGYRSLGVGVGSIIVVTDSGYGDMQAFHVSERAYGQEDTPAQQWALRDRPRVPLPEDDDLPERGVYEVVSVDPGARRLELAPVEPMDVPVPPSLRQWSADGVLI